MPVAMAFSVVTPWPGLSFCPVVKANRAIDRYTIGQAPGISGECSFLRVVFSFHRTGQPERGKAFSQSALPLSGGRLGLALTRVTASSSQKELSVLGRGRHPRIGGVEVGGDSELFDVDFRLALEAMPGGP
jgi:hypothetical protein